MAARGALRTADSGRLAKNAVDGGIFRDGLSSSTARCPSDARKCDTLGLHVDRLLAGKYAFQCARGEQEMNTRMAGFGVKQRQFEQGQGGGAWSVTTRRSIPTAPRHDPRHDGDSDHQRNKFSSPGSFIVREDMVTRKSSVAHRHLPRRRCRSRRRQSPCFNPCRTS